MAATEVRGFVTVTKEGEVFLRTGSQLSELLIRGYDYTKSEYGLVHFGFITEKIETICEIDFAIHIARTYR